MNAIIRGLAVVACGLVIAGCVEYRVDPVTGKEYEVVKKGDPELDAALERVEEQPNDARSWYQLGEVYERRAAYLDALDAYTRMQVEIEKLEKTEKRTYTGGLYKIGETLVRLRRYQQARSYLDRVVAHQPKERRQAVLNLNFRKAHKLLAAIYQAVQEWELAEKHALAFRDLGGGNDCDDILIAAAKHRRPKVVEPSYDGEGEAKPAGAKEQRKDAGAAKAPAKPASPGDTPRK